MSYFRNIVRAILGQQPASVATPPQPVAQFAPVATDTRAAARAAITTALSNPEYEFRTIGALVKAVGSGATESFVRDVIASMPGVRSAYGKPHLFGLTDRIGASPRGFAY